MQNGDVYSQTEREVILHATETVTLPYDPETAEQALRSNDRMELGIVTAGSGVHLVTDQAIPCRENDIYIVAPGILHAYLRNADGGDLTVRTLSFRVSELLSGEAAEEGSRDYCYGVFRDSAVTSYAMLNAKTRREVDALVDAIALELKEKKSAWREAVRANLSLLLITVGRYVSGAIKNNEAAPTKEWAIASRAVRLIAERFSDKELTLETIADVLYVSQSHLSRIFKRLMGRPFTEYLRSIRLDHACALLRETELTVEEIVEACGLRDVPSFYHRFFAYTGMKPNGFRALYGRGGHITDPNHTTKGDKIMIILSEISENLQRGKSKIVKEMVAEAIAEGCDPERILNEGLLDGMNVIGEKFKNNEVYVPEVLVAARAMNMGMQVLKPELQKSGVKATGRVCIGTVQGDLHDIGKNLVKMMLEGKGLDVVDLGTDVAPETFVETAIAENCSVICCSALLTTTMGAMEDVVRIATEKGVRDRVRIMIGGAPVSQEYCDRIGADCYTPDAASAADAAVAFCKEQ